MVLMNIPKLAKMNLVSLIKVINLIAVTINHFIAQMFEERKLHLTVDLQLSLQQAQDNPEDDLMQANSRGIQNR
jgi:hypothetical protein